MMENSKDTNHKNPFGKLLEARRRIRKIARNEEGAVNIEEQVWRIYGSGLRDYNESFYQTLDALDLRSFEGYVEERQRRGKKTFVLDVMAEGTFLRQLPGIDGGLAVTLVDKRAEKSKALDQSKNIDVIAGDILSPKTWRQISQWMQDRDISSFDLIVCRGVGALLDIPQELYSHILTEVWGRLSKDGGVLVTQFPPKAEELARKLQHQLSLSGVRAIIQREKSGIQYDSASYPAIAVIKTDQAPEQWNFG